MVNNALITTKQSRNALIADLVANDLNIKTALTEVLGLATKEDADPGSTAVQPAQLQAAIQQLIVNTLNGDEAFADSVADALAAKANKVEVQERFNNTATAAQGAKADTAVQLPTLNAAIATLIAETLNGDLNFGNSVWTAINAKATTSTLAPVAFTGTSTDIVETGEKAFIPVSERLKVSRISLVGSVDLDQLSERVAALSAGVIIVGNWDAAGKTKFPVAADYGLAQITKGNIFFVTSDATIDGVQFKNGDRIISVADNPSSTAYANNWFKEDFTDAVSTVAGKTGNVLLYANDITDATDIGKDLLRASTPGVARGVIQAQTASTVLSAITSAGIANDKLLYGTGASSFAQTNFTAFGRSLIDDADAGAGRATLGLGSAAVLNTGTSGASIGRLDTANTWGAAQTFSARATFTLGADLASALKFGSTSVTDPLDLSRHVDLWGGSYGLGVSNGWLNYVSGGNHRWYGNNVLLATLDQSGNLMIVGNLYRNGPAGVDRGWSMQTNGKTRWFVFNNAEAEGGGNLGSNFAIARYDDDGNYIDSPIYINRKFGSVYFAKDAVVAGNNMYVGPNGTRVQHDGNLYFSGSMKDAWGNDLSSALAVANAPKGLGVGQTWQDVMSSRGINVVYQNTSGKPIWISAEGFARSSFCEVQVSQNGSTWITPSYAGYITSSDTTYYRNSSNVVVPDGWYYRMTAGSNYLNIIKWLELR